MLISACMMVKNEEEMLGRALESIRGEVDEIVVVDTGSTDRTVEIARAYTDRIYFHEWFHDFSGMRNITMEYARGEWILILDADDEFVRQQSDLGLKDFLKNPVANLYAFHLENTTAEGRVTSTLNQIRLIRNGMGLRYQGIVHNQLMCQGHSAATAPFTVKHYGYDLEEEKMEKKRRRSEILLEKMIAEGGDAAYAYYQLAKIHSSRKDLRKALETARKGAEMLGEETESPVYHDLHYQIAANAFNLKELDTAFEEASKLLKLHSVNPDAAFIIIACRHERKEWEEIIRFFPTYLKCRRSYEEHPEWYPYILHMVHMHEDAVYMHGEALIHSGREDRLQDSVGDLWDNKDKGAYFLNLLAKSAAQKGQRAVAVRFLERALTLDPQFLPARNNLDLLQSTGTKVVTRFVSPDSVPREPGVGETKARAVLETAAGFMARGNFDEAERSLLTIEDLLRGEVMTNSALAEILGPTYEGLGVIQKRKGNLGAAKVWLSKSVEADGRRADTRIVLSEVLKGLGDYDGALEHAETAVNLAPQSPKALLTRALVRLEAGDHRSAEKDLVKLVQRHEDYALGAFNLGSFFWNRNRRLDALDWLARALHLEPANREYAESFFKSQAALENAPTVSLCMMVKNEEAHLEKALESVAGAVDEIIVVDTGSQDRTVEIIRSFGARLYEHPWFDDFSGMRNITLSYARGDWVLILDADEELDDSGVEPLREQASNTNRAAVTFRVFNYLSDGRRKAEQNSVRLFRNHKGFRYAGIVHNMLIYRGRCEYSPVAIHHYGYDLGPEVKRKKYQRTVGLLEKRIGENYEDMDAHYYLINTYQSVGRLDDAVSEGETVLRLAEEKELDLAQNYYADTYPRLGQLYISKGEWPKAVSVLEKGLNVCPHHPELQVSLAYCRFQEGRLEEAAACLEEAHQWYLKYRSGEFVPFYTVTMDGLLLVNNMANILLQIGREEEARSKVRVICADEPGLSSRGLEKATGLLEAGDGDALRWELTWLRLADAASPEVQEGVGELFLRSGHPDAAVEYYDSLEAEGVELSSRSSLYKVQGLLDLDRTEQAETTARAAVERFPADPEALKAMARVLEKSGNNLETARVLEDLLRVSPEEPQLRNIIGELYYLTGQYDLAEEYFHRELREQGESPDPYNNLGVLSMGRNRIDEACEHFRHCLALNPDHPEAKQNLEFCANLASGGDGIH